MDLETDSILYTQSLEACNGSDMFMELTLEEV